MPKDLPAVASHPPKEHFFALHIKNTRAKNYVGPDTVTNSRTAFGDNKRNTISSSGSETLRSSRSLYINLNGEALAERVPHGGFEVIFGFI